MEFFCFHRDREGSTQLRAEMVEEHWTYMDGFADAMIARGPTFRDDGTLTGSVHILDLPDAAAARAFAFEEPGYQAGAYRDVLLRRWRNALGRTMWAHEAVTSDHQRYLVLGFTTEPSNPGIDVPVGDRVIASGPLLSDDGAVAVGAAVLVPAPDARARVGVASRRPLHRGRGASVAPGRSSGRLTADAAVRPAAAAARRRVRRRTGG